MTSRAAKPQRPRHIPILDEYWEWIEKAYGPSSDSKLGVGPAIRAIVHDFVKMQKALIQKKLDARPAGAKPQALEKQE